MAQGIGYFRPQPARGQAAIRRQQGDESDEGDDERHVGAAGAPYRYRKK
jgi:hypothetical protein